RSVRKKETTHRRGRRGYAKDAKPSRRLRRHRVLCVSSASSALKRSVFLSEAARMTDRILILDFGSQVTQLIARRVRENGVYSEIQPYTASEEKIRAFDPRGIILSGGPASVTVATTPRAPDTVFHLGVPVLALCYGMQTMCAQLGGRVTLSDHQEFGRAFIDVVGECRLFAGLWPQGAREQVWMSHGDKVDMVPSGFRAVAMTDTAP